MPNANNPNSIALSPTGSYAAAVQTNTVVSKQARITAGGSRSSRFDFYVGKVGVTGSVTAKVQHSSGYNLWSDANTVAITASTDKSVSAVNTTLNTLTVTGHGFVANQPIVFISSGDTPAPLHAGKIYFAIVVDTNTIKVREFLDSDAIDITAAGSGTITVTAARVFSITHQDTVTADQAYTPLKSSGRAVVSLTNAADLLQLCDVVILLDD